MVVLFLLAVIAVVLAVDFVAAVAWTWIESGKPIPLIPLPRMMLVAVSLATAGTIFIVSVINVTQLASGGKAVAEMIGARQVPSNTTDPLERRLLNVVEEMAIASGV